MDVKKEARLLKENEKRIVTEVCKTVDASPIYKHPIVFVIVFLGAALYAGFLGWMSTGSIWKSALVFALILAGLMGLLWGIWASNVRTVKWIMAQMEADQLYATEAIYEKTTGKYHIVFISTYVKGQMKLVGRNLKVCEPVKAGDKVIVLRMRGQKWVFKARA